MAKALLGNRARIGLLFSRTCYFLRTADIVVRKPNICVTAHWELPVETFDRFLVTHSEIGARKVAL